jgi:hypothetical protein
VLCGLRSRPRRQCCAVCVELLFELCERRGNRFLRGCFDPGRRQLGHRFATERVRGLGRFEHQGTKTADPDSFLFGVIAQRAAFSP